MQISSRFLAHIFRKLKRNFNVCINLTRVIFEDAAGSSAIDQIRGEDPTLKVKWTKRKKNPFNGFLLMLTYIVGWKKDNLKAHVKPHFRIAERQNIKKFISRTFVFLFNFVHFEKNIMKNLQGFGFLWLRKRIFLLLSGKQKKKTKYLNNIIQIGERNVFDDLKHAYYTLCLYLLFPKVACIYKDLYCLHNHDHRQISSFVSRKCVGF